MGLNGLTLALINLAALLGGACVVLGLAFLRWGAMQLARWLPWAWVRWFERLARSGPSRGRLSRLVVGIAVFVGLGSLLLFPLFAEPVAEAGRWRVGLDFSGWLVSVCVAVSGLCVALSAWEPRTRWSGWSGLMLLLAAGQLALVSRQWLTLSLLSLEVASLAFGALLAVWSPPEAGADRGRLHHALRGYLASSVLASALTWAGIAWSGRAWSVWLVATGVLVRCGMAPMQVMVLGALRAASAPVAMGFVGILWPVAVVVFLRVCPAFSPAMGGVFGVMGGMMFISSVREEDLRVAAGRWVLGAGMVTMGGLLLLAHPARALIATEAVVGISCAGGMLVFLVGLIEHDLGHREISRLRGLAARSPGAFGWSLLAGLFLVGAPPGAMFASGLRLGYPWSMAGLLVVGGGCVISVLHRTYLGLPRRPDADESPIDLTGRQRLVLLLLLVMSVAAAAAQGKWG